MPAYNIVDHTFDVVVVGAGGAGLRATLECASRGLDYTDPVKSERFQRELQHMRNTWGSLVESADPFHNPNLLFAGDYFEIPSLPRRKKPWHSVFEQVFNLKQRFGLAQDVA